MQRRNKNQGFTLIELLVVIGIIAVLMSVLAPALSKARESAKSVNCASNLKQIATAFNMYLLDSQGKAFWRGKNIGFDGMDWYVYGGKETGNTYVGGQGNFFNQWQPRPLNKFVGGKLQVFHCPSDDSPAPWGNLESTAYDWVGTSYQFNADGYPGTDTFPVTLSKPYVPESPAGLAGLKVAHVKNSSNTVMFLEAAMQYQVRWHPKGKGNVCYVDGHVTFQDMPTPPQAIWR